MATQRTATPEGQSIKQKVTAMRDGECREVPLRAPLSPVVRFLTASLMLSGSLAAEAYAAPPIQNQAPATQSAPPPGTAPATKSPAAAIGLYVYPTKQQDPNQQTKDEGECFDSAKQQTGWDPAAPQAQTAAPADAGKQPSGGAVKGSAKGAAGGAAIGAIAGDAGKGAAIGATTGAVAGRRGQKKARKQQEQQAEQTAQSQQQQQADGFRRSMSACLEARGYTAK